MPQSPQPDAPMWGYDEENGPAHWHCLEDEFMLCGEGKAQSPIDLTRAAVTSLQPITFDYHEMPLAIFNNGRTIQVKTTPGSQIIYNEKAYDLLQFHFHQPSEHTIEGEPSAMELHLVHRNATSGNLAVVGVMLVQGQADNDSYRAVFDHLPADIGEPDEKTERKINPAHLLPDDPTRFYTYEGSLTTPPCSEIVRWLVLANPVALSAAQLAAFGSIHCGNVRPVQPLNNRDLFTNQG